MARFNFGGDLAAFLILAPSGQSNVVKAQPGATGSVYAARTGGSPLTDLLDQNGSATTTITSNSDGFINRFQGPDNVTDLWADFGGGSRFHLGAVDTWPSAAAALAIYQRGPTNIPSWTTSEAVVARALGWAIMADPANGGVADCNGTQGNGTDNLAAFNTAAATGKPVYFGPGTWRMSGQMAGASVYGAGGGHPAVAGSAKTTIVFDSGVSGVKLNQIAAHLENVYLVGGGGTTNDGIKIENSWTVVRDVSVKGFSRHGYNLDSSSPVGVFDQAQVQTLHVYNCGGNGHNVVGGSDSNACTFTAVDCVGNTGWGIWNVNAAHQSYIGGHCSQNTAGGVHDDGNSNMYDVYIEGGTGNTFDFGSTSSNGILLGRAYAMPTLTGSVSAATQSWEIHKSGAQKGYLTVEDVTAAQTGRWSLRVGVFATGWLELVANGGTQLMRADPTITATSGAYWYTSVNPSATSTVDLGKAANYWKDLYVNQHVRPSVTKTANYTLTSADNIVIFNGTSLTATLPDPTTAGLPGRVFVVKNIAATSLTVNSAGTSKTLDGAASQTLAQWAKASYTSDGTQWLTV